MIALEQQTYQRELATKLCEASDRLKARDWIVIRLWFKHLSKAQVAAQLQISTTRVSQVLSRFFSKQIGTQLQSDLDEWWEAL